MTRSISERHRCIGTLDVIFPEWVTIDGTCRHITDLVGQPGDADFHSLDTLWLKTHLSETCEDCRVLVTWHFLDAQGQLQVVAGPQLQPAVDWSSPP
jgi:hypothetical protein